MGCSAIFYQWNFHICGAGIAFLCVVLSAYSYWIDPTGQAHEIFLLLMILGCMAVYYAIAVWSVLRGKTKAGLGAVVGWAVVFRLLLLASQPILETDYYRYLWDGFVLSHGFNPYQFAPGEVLSREAIEGLSDEEAHTLECLRSLAQKRSWAQEILSEVNNPSVITIYPPFAQILFGISATFFPLSVIGWRVVILFFDAILILTLTVLMARFGRDPRRVLIYAWSPLVLKETINTLHFDIIATAGLFLGVLFALSNYNKRSAVAWVCATLTKIYPVLVAPLWIRKRDWRSWAILTAMLAGLLFLFSGAGERGISGWATFANRWESNSSVVFVLEKALEGLGVPRWGEGVMVFRVAGIAYSLDAFLLAKIMGACGVLALAAGLICKAMRTDIDDEQRLRWTSILVGTVILCSPVCNPWYVTWIVPFLCFYPRVSWFYLSIACFVHYTFFIPEPWGYLPYVRELEYAPFFGILIWEWRISFGRNKDGKKLSIIQDKRP